MVRPRRTPTGADPRSKYLVRSVTRTRGRVCAEPRHISYPRASIVVTKPRATPYLSLANGQNLALRARTGNLSPMDHNRSEAIRKVYRPQLAKGMYNNSKARPQAVCKTSFQLYEGSTRAYNPRSYSCARAVYSTKARVPNASVNPQESGKISPAGQSKGKSSFYVREFDADYSTSTWKKQTNSSTDPTSSMRTKVASVQMQSHILDCSVDRTGKSESLDMMRSGGTLSLAAKSSSMPVPGESVEEIHYFFVAFHQRAKRILQVEARIAKAVRENKKSIATVDEDEDLDG